MKRIKFKLSKNKKAQMEMFGIAIVVILLSLGMLFGVRFVLMKPKSTAKESFTQKELAQNFVSALLITTIIECNRQDITEIIEDCATYRSLQCGPVGSCDYLKTNIQDILDQTFGVWNRPYRLTIKKDGQLLENLYFNSTAPCFESRPGWGFIPLYPGNVEVRLDVC